MLPVFEMYAIYDNLWEIDTNINICSLRQQYVIIGIRFHVMTFDLWRKDQQKF